MQAMEKAKAVPLSQRILRRLLDKTETNDDDK